MNNYLCQRAMLLLLVAVNPVFADSLPYLLQQIEHGKPSSEAIAKAKKQIADLHELKLQEISLVPFHLRKQQPINPSSAYCTECHLSLPHQKSVRARAFLNMHTDYIACETCHYRPEQSAFTYAWLDMPQQKLLGAQTEVWRSGRPADAKTPMPARDGKLKIVPLFQGEWVSASKDHPALKAIYQRWKEAAAPEKAELKAKLHAPLSAKGPECQACHISAAEAKMQTGKGQLRTPWLNLSALGANAQQQAAIEQNTVAAFFAHYQPEPETESTATTSLNSKPNSAKEQRIRITQFLK